VEINEVNISSLQLQINFIELREDICRLWQRRYCICDSGGSKPGVWGGSQILGRQKCLHLLKYQRLSATKVVIFCRSI